MGQPVQVRKAGFALIEMVLVVAILVLGFSLLLPAMQKVRTQARLSSCKNNLKRIGLALHNYHDVFRTFPPGWVKATPYPQSTSGYGWQAALLPFVEEAHMYDQLEFTRPLGAAAFEHPGSEQEKKPLAVFRCPADPTEAVNTMRGGWATSNYSGNFGSDQLPRLGQLDAAEYWPGSLMTPIGSSGFFHWNSRIRMRDTYDGTSNTLIVGERGVKSAAGIWAGVRSNSLENDQVTDCSVGNEINSNPNAFSSMHNSGMHGLFADGSVRFFNENLDSGKDPRTGRIGVFQRLGSRNDGVPLPRF